MKGDVVRHASPPRMLVGSVLLHFSYQFTFSDIHITIG